METSFYKTVNPELKKSCFSRFFIISQDRSSRSLFICNRTALNGAGKKQGISTDSFVIPANILTATRIQTQIASKPQLLVWDMNISSGTDKNCRIASFF
jgi:hypothetical protein